MFAALSGNCREFERVFNMPSREVALRALVSVEVEQIDRYFIQVEVRGNSDQPTLYANLKFGEFSLAKDEPLHSLACESPCAPSVNNAPDSHRDASCALGIFCQTTIHKVLAARIA